MPDVDEKEQRELDELSDLLSEKIDEMWAANEKAPMMTTGQAKGQIHKDLFGFIHDYTAQKCKEARRDQVMQDFAEASLSLDVDEQDLINCRLRQLAELNDSGREN